MRATHTDYLHPRHLRVETDVVRTAYNSAKGYHQTNVLCVAPSSLAYGKLNRPSLPSYPGERKSA